MSSVYIVNRAKRIGDEYEAQQSFQRSALVIASVVAQNLQALLKY
jgi:hypothetical protein